MLHAPPGMSPERWELHLLEQRRAAGEDVTFTPEQVAMLQQEAAEANEVFSADELREVYGPAEAA